jgi:hypothetical protein
VAAERTPLESLLEDMRDLRLTLAADLNAAAGAAEHGAGGVASDIMEADREELARFARVADQRLLRLQRLATAGPETPRWRRRLVVSLPVVPVVGAMALSAAAATGALPIPGDDAHPRQPAIAAAQAGASAAAPADSLAELVDVIGNDPSASQVIAAASQLHRQIRHLIATSPNDPKQVSQIAELIRMEQSLLLRAQPPGVDVVLDATRKLAAKLVPTITRPVAPTTVPSLAPDVDATPRDHKPDEKASPEPRKTTSTPKPSKSPTSSPTQSPSGDGDPLPHLPE